VSNKEGIIKFNLIFKLEKSLFFDDEIIKLNKWRSLLFKANLIGCDPSKYNGFGYGNISMLAKPYNKRKKAFIISGTQTGKFKKLSKKHYCLVTDWNIEKKSLTGTGPIKPSSESITHAVLYQIDNSIRSVIHVHSPDIWNNAKRFNIPTTKKSAEYGTIEMANEIKRLYKKKYNKDINLFTMGGHTDGVISFGKSIDDAGFGIIRTFLKCMSVNG